MLSEVTVHTVHVKKRACTWDFWEISSPPEAWPAPDASWWTQSSGLAAVPGGSPEERTSPCSFTRTAFSYNTRWNLPRLPPSCPLGTISLRSPNLCLEDFSTWSSGYFLKVLLQHNDILSWMRRSCLPTCPPDPLQRFTKPFHVLEVCFRKSWIFYSNNASKNYWHISLSRWPHSWTVKWNLCIETCLNPAQHFSRHWMCIFLYILCSFKPKSSFCK